MNPEQDRNRLIEILLERSFKLGDFILSSGKKSDYYVDCRTTTLHPEGQKLIMKLMMPIVKEWEIEQVGGLTLGADPIISTLTLATSGVIEEYSKLTPLTGFIVRKQAKAHGTGKLWEGILVADKKTLIVEDVITTGGSALQAIEEATRFGANVVGVLAIVDREEGGRELLVNKGLKVHSLFTATELKQAARAKGS